MTSTRTGPRNGHKKVKSAHSDGFAIGPLEMEKEPLYSNGKTTSRSSPKSRSKSRGRTRRQRAGSAGIKRDRIASPPKRRRTQRRRPGVSSGSGATNATINGRTNGHNKTGSPKKVRRNHTAKFRHHSTSNGPRPMKKAHTESAHTRSHGRKGIPKNMISPLSPKGQRHKSKLPTDDALPLLHMAAKKGDEQAVLSLLAKKVNINKRERMYGTTALHQAVKRGKIGVVKILLENNANPNIKDKKQKTALHWATSKQEPAGLVNVLLDYGNDIEPGAKDHKNRTPLHVAVMYGTPQGVKALTEVIGKQINAKNREWKRPLHLAVRYSEESEKILLGSPDIKIDAVDLQGRTPLHIASREGKLESVKRLLSAGASVNAKDDSKLTALHYAAGFGNLSVTKLLIEKGAHVNMRDVEERTPLHLAGEGEYHSVCHALTSAGADVSALYDLKTYRVRQHRMLVARRSTVDMGSIPDRQVGYLRRNSMIPLTPRTIRQTNRAQWFVRPMQSTDKYGFIKKKHSMVNATDADDASSSSSDVTDAPKMRNTDRRERKELERADKWAKMLKNWGEYSEAKIRRRTYKGIPDKVRGESWKRIANIKAMREANPGIYKSNLDKRFSGKNVSINRQIDLDVERTWRNHLMFKERYGPGQIALFNILKAYSHYDPDVGYCQSMSDITAFLLFYMEEEDAFWMLVHFCHSQKFHMQELFTIDMTELKMNFYVHNRMFEDKLPKLYQHFQKEDIHPSGYASEWYMRLFMTVLDLEVVLRVWDLFILEGYDIFFTVAFCILKELEDRLIKADMVTIMTVINKDIKTQGVLDAQELMKNVKTHKLKQSYLNKLKREYRNQNPPDLEERMKANTAPH